MFETYTFNYDITLRFCNKVLLQCHAIFDFITFDILSCEDLYAAYF